MRVTSNISDDLIAEVQKITGKKSKTKAISTAMTEFVREKKIKKLLALKGKLKIKDVTEELENLEYTEKKENDKRWGTR